MRILKVFFQRKRQMEEHPHYYTHTIPSDMGKFIVHETPEAKNVGIIFTGWDQGPTSQRKKNRKERNWSRHQKQKKEKKKK
jgi:hypothetical protein